MKSDRRRARQARSGATHGEMPAEISSRTHPFWEERKAALAKYQHLIDADEKGSVRTERNIHPLVVRAWAEQNGFTDDIGSIDWRRLRAALRGEDDEQPPS